tara:strand:- start:675 stop:1001 length:327 start_codon:yes stop_codon:yes gene_type:complete
MAVALPRQRQTGNTQCGIVSYRLFFRNAETLKVKRRRFEANLDQVQKIYDVSFCRMGRFYLVASELAFRRGGRVLFHIQLAKKPDAVPLTRDYLATRGRRDELATGAA